VPAAVLSATLDVDSGAQSLVQVVDPAPAQIPSPAAIQRAINLLAGAQRPLIILGKGAAYAQADQEIRNLIESTGVPYLPMSMAKGLLNDAHPQSAASARSVVLAQADVVMLVGARLNWLLAHGKSPQWSSSVKFIQLDIAATEMDSNRAIEAPVVGDIRSSIHALLAGLKPGQVKPSGVWLDLIATHKQRNAEKMATHLNAQPSPMDYYSAFRVIRDVLATRPELYVVNEGANTLDFGRNILDMQQARKRLDAGTWGVMGIGMGYAIGAAITSGQPVLAIEGDSAFGFSGMEIETICRYQLSIVVVVFNNGGIYHGDEINHQGRDPAPTVLMQTAHYEKLIEAFGGAGHFVSAASDLQRVLTEALDSGKPALINCVIDPSAGTESGHLKNLNPQSALGGKH